MNREKLLKLIRKWIKGFLDKQLEVFTKTKQRENIFNKLLKND